MREVDIALRRIGIRNHNAHALRASLHGVKIPLKNVSAPADTHGKQIDDKLADAAINAAIARKRQEVNRGKS